MLSRYSVKRPYTVIVGIVLILLLGYVSFTDMQTDLLPDMTLPYAVVYTTYPGASPEEVETVVTRPVEQAMATTSNIENINSVSSENISIVVLEFSQSANMDAVTIEMRESLDQIESYWDDSIGSPVIMKMNPDMLPVMVAAMEAGELSQSELTDLVNNEVLPELESIEGVASVSASGTIEEQVQVLLREDKIRDVNEKIRKALDDQFTEAQSELEAAQQEIEDGQQKLSDGQIQLAGQTSSAKGQLDAGTAKMITGQLQIDQKMAQADAGLSQIETSESELDAKEKELLEAETALLQLPAQKELLSMQQEQLKTAINQLETAPTQIGALEAAIAKLEIEISVLEEQIRQLGGQTETPETESDTVLPESGDLAEGEVSLSENDETLTQASDAAESFAAGDAEIVIDEAQMSDAQVDYPLVDGVNAGNAENTENTLEGAGEHYGSDGTLDILSQEVIGSATGDMSAGDVSTDAALAKLQAELIEKQAEKAKYEGAKAQAIAALSALGVNISEGFIQMTESIDTVKSGLVSQKLQLEEGLAKLQKSIDEMPKQMAAITEGKTAIASGRTQLTATKKQLRQAKKQLSQAKKQIASGQNTVAEAIAQLNSAQISATIEMAVGKAELNAGKKEIDAALEQVRAQKETAYDQADASQIITADMVKGILAAQNFSMPAGYVTEDGTDFLVRIGDKFDKTDDLNKLVILDLHIDGIDPILLSDVAEVTVIDDSDTIYAKVNGREGVMFTMQKQSGYSTGDVSKKIKEKFTALETANEDVHIIRLMDQGIYIDLVVDSVMENMISGAVLAILVLLVFLKSFRPTFVIACSIPISIMTAVVLMFFSDITLNIISLSGLALGIGMLVDNSIVVIENIYRLRSEGYSAPKAAIEGARQVAGAIAASTLTTICVFAPIVFTKGITRQLFVDMGLTIAYSLVASLVIALTFVPMMGAGLLKNVQEKPSRFFDALQNRYAALLRGSLKVKFLVLFGAVVLLGLSGYLAISKGTAFMPEMESTQVSVSVQAPKGSTLAQTGALADEVTQRILEIPDVTDVGAMNSSGTMGGMTGGGGSSERENISMYVLLKEDKELSGEELTEQILKKTADIGCEVNVETSTMDMSALGGSGISVKIKGRELDRIKSMAADVAKILSDVEGTKNVSDGIEEKTLELRLVVDKNKAMEYQLTTAQVYQMLQQKLADASSATTLTTLSKDYSVFVVSDTDETLTREKIKKLTVTGKDKENKEVEVPLSEIVQFQDTEGFSSINREEQSRYVTVTAEVDDGYNIGLVSAQATKALENYEVPDGYSIEMAGEDETINEAMGEVAKMLGLAVVFMYLIMVAQFQSLLSPFIVMFTIPLAFTGGLFGLYLTDNPISVIAMIGFVMLSGIIVNNGIVLVDYINQLRRQGMEKKEAIVEAGRTRLRPIIMTALTTILGLLTMAFGMGMGADMIQPMAIVTIGGLTYGTLLTLFVVPCIYDILNRKKDIREEEI